MSRLVILCIEDEDEVRDAVVRDLEVFEPTFLVEMAEDADDARQVVVDTAEAGDEVALVIADHRLPGMQGTDFLYSNKFSCHFGTVTTSLFASPSHNSLVVL